MARIALSKSRDAEKAEWQIKIAELLETGDIPEEVANGIRAALEEGGYDADEDGAQNGGYDADADGAENAGVRTDTVEYGGDDEPEETESDEKRQRGQRGMGDTKRRARNAGRHGRSTAAGGDNCRKSCQSATAVDGYMRAPVHPEVRKALDEVRTLRDGLERESMVALAKKYEGVCSGVSCAELADRLTKLKGAGGGAYDEYVELLDELAESRRVAPFMKEYGSSRHADASLEGHVAEIMRAHPELSRAQAVVKAYQSDPELPEII